MKNLKWEKIINSKRTYYVLGAVFVAVLLLNSFGGGSFSMNPSGGIFAEIIKSVDRVGEMISSRMNFQPDNSQAKLIEKLEKENQELKKTISQNMITDADLKELKELKSYLNYVANDSIEQYISTSIIYKNDGNYFTSFVIDAGESNGVKKDSIVVGPNGLLGMIFEVDKNYSKGISILNSKLSISFEALRDKEISGVASQNIAFNVKTDLKGYVKGYLFDKEQMLYPGDVLITSGLGLYPGGIQIGEVEEVIEDKSNILRYVKIKPYTNFKTVNKVIVINPREMP